VPGPLPGRRVRFHLKLPVPRQASRLQLQASLLSQLGRLGCLLVLGTLGDSEPHRNPWVNLKIAGIFYGFMDVHLKFDG